jgi:hypothetical protein
MRFADPGRQQRRTLDERDPRMPHSEVANDSCCRVRPLIVDHQQVETAGRVIQRQQGFQAQPDIGFLVACRNDDGDMRRAGFAGWQYSMQAWQKPALFHSPQDQPRHDREP